MNSPATQETPTAQLIAQARALQSTVLPGQAHGTDNPAKSALREAAGQLIAAALYRDLSAAMVAAAKTECAANGEEFMYNGAPYTLLSRDSYKSDGGREAPVRYTQQCSYRDHSGWLCKTERMAKWVAGWIAKYLDPRDSDGNSSANRVNEIRHEGKPSQWLAVTGSYKVAD